MKKTLTSLDTPPLLMDVDNVSKYFFDSDGNKNTILSGVSFAINVNESISIVGPSGSGKSTLLAIMAGLDVPDEGSVFLSGGPFSSLSENDRAKCRQGSVSFVFQSFQLLPSLSALENVMLPLELLGEKAVVARKKASFWLDAVGLSSRLSHMPRLLSGGEQQRCAVARAFVTEPEILFADEPTGNLDRATGQILIELLFSLTADAGKTLAVVTHDKILANKCSRKFVLNNGKLEEKLS